METTSRQFSVPAGRHWSAPTTTQQKSIDFDHEIMENEKKEWFLPWNNEFGWKKCRHSSNPGQDTE
jgi:hypothetical protein